MHKRMNDEAPTGNDASRVEHFPLPRNDVPFVLNDAVINQLERLDVKISKGSQNLIVSTVVPWTLLENNQEITIESMVADHTGDVLLMVNGRNFYIRTGFINIAEHLKRDNIKISGNSITFYLKDLSSVTRII